jgi:MerR family transcriptional regulator, light-induced transcriptional regulator
MTSSFDERCARADRLRTLRAVAAEQATQLFLTHHPDWTARYGELARLRGNEDAAFHVDYLAAAIQAGETEAFTSYARWTARVLESRGIRRTFLAENLDQVADALAARLEPDDAAAVRDLVAAARTALDAPDAPLDPSPDPFRLTRQVFLQALLTGNRRAAAGAALEVLREGHAPQELYVGLFQETLYEIGRLWELNRITVAEEHMATAVAQVVLGEIYPKLPIADRGRGAAIVTGVEGELHQIGGHMVSDILETRGWQVRFLGTNAPHATILQVMEHQNATLVGISATMLFNVPKVAALVSAIRTRFPDRVRILLGGSAFRFSPGLYREIGADAFASDLRELARLDAAGLL